MSVKPSKSFEPYLYHLTNKTLLDSILKEGLVPNIGTSSKMADEPEPAIFLCDNISLPYWQILLDRDILLKIKLLESDTYKIFDYELYKEYVLKDKIPNDRIEIIPLPKPSIEKYKKLLKSYICTISCACCYCAEYYTYGKENTNITLDIIERCILTVQIVANRLDYSYMPRNELKDELEGLGQDGYYTFLDKYRSTNKSIWEKLIEYPKDNTYESREWLYNFVKKQFSNVLDVDTGGWGV